MMAEEKKEKEEFKEVKKYNLVYQIYSQSIEELYFWFIGWFKDDLREKVQLPIEKITDMFSATEASSFFGTQAQRLGIQQDKASQYLKGISEMTKGLFQMVREIRILDERLSYYEKSFKDDEDAMSAEITLKGLYIDLVEGGSKSPASVYGLASQVGFATLPDLFFRAKVNAHKGETVGNVVETSYKDFNEKVKEVLKRKLMQYYTWKEATYKELTIRKKFTLSHLRQHYNSMKLYMAWLKPYLKHVKRLSMDQKRLDTADMIAGMEQAMLEMEILVRLKPKKDLETEQESKFIPVINMTFTYRTAPQMAYQDKESYQKGPIHVGRTEIEMKGYVMTKEEIERFKIRKEEEDFELLGSINDSIQASLDALGEDLKKYLEEGGELFEKKKKEEKEKEEKLSIFQKALSTLVTKGKKTKEKRKEENIFKIFFLPFKGLFELADSMTGVSRLAEPKEKRRDIFNEEKQKKEAQKELKVTMWATYNIFKKAHGMITW
jgi:hypothetical protein